jgi:pimeloyl-ACP methyl ester carboxylesterase
MMEQQPKSIQKNRVVKTLGIFFLCVVLVLYVFLPFGMGAFATMRSPVAQEPPPEGFEAVSLSAADGTPLACWYGAGENGACVILVHGSKSNLTSVRAHAAFLREAGYGVLALTLRGHGGSGGRGNAFGWQSDQDIAAAVDYLQEQNVERIGALGLSLGAEVLLGSAAQEPQIAAIVTDGASQRSLSDYFALPANRSLWRSWSTRVMYAAVELLSGQTPPEWTLLDSIASSQSTRFLFIAAGNVEKESRYGDLFVKAAGGRASLWVVPGAGHTQGLFVQPEEYSSRVVGFFNETLLQIG